MQLVDMHNRKELIRHPCNCYEQQQIYDAEVSVHHIGQLSDTIDMQQALIFCSGTQIYRRVMSPTGAFYLQEAVNAWR